MKTFHCVACNKQQAGGRFCLDCGKPLQEKIVLGVAFKPIHTSRATNVLQKDIRQWLARIGVQAADIRMANEGDNAARVEYSLTGKKYSFASFRQERFADNLAAIEVFLHNRVIGIERGIETAEQAFHGYAQIAGPTSAYPNLSDRDLRELLKKHHPDTGDGDTEALARVMEEINRRRT